MRREGYRMADNPTARYETQTKTRLRRAECGRWASHPGGSALAARLAQRKAHVDLWLKEIALTTELRKWFGHDPARWPEFQERYRRELKANDEQVQLLKLEMKTRNVTLVYGAKDEEHNAALVLKEFVSS